jgi:hypothetical protein
VRRQRVAEQCVGYLHRLEVGPEVDRHDVRVDVPAVEL